MKPLRRTGGGPLLPLAIDSGAHAIYQANTPLISEKRSLCVRRPAGKRVVEGLNQAFLDSEDFNSYLQRYIDFVKEYGKTLSYCVTLDIPGSAEATWTLYRKFTSRGLKVMPVFHIGEDPSYLKKYLAETDYIGLGGLVQMGSRHASLEFQRRTWRMLTDDRGRPIAKVHGFALTALRALETRPYYSVDSSRAFTIARYGGILVPQKVGKGFVFNSKPLVLSVSRPSANGSRTARHAAHHDPNGLNRKAVDEYLDSVGVTMEQVVEEGGWRDIVNLHYMNSMMHTVAQQHSEAMGIPFQTTYYTSGCFFSAPSVFVDGVKHLSARGQTKYLAYLGTFYAPRPIRLLYEHWMGKTLAVKSGKTLRAAPSNSD